MSERTKHKAETLNSINVTSFEMLHFVRGYMNQNKNTPNAQYGLEIIFNS